MLDTVCSEVMVALKQQGEADLGRSMHAVLKWGCLTWIVSKRSIALDKQKGHENEFVVRSTDHSAS